jgi:hypothetical protein
MLPFGKSSKVDRSMDSAGPALAIIIHIDNIIRLGNVPWATKGEGFSLGDENLREPDIQLCSRIPPMLPNPAAVAIATHYKEIGDMGGLTLQPNPRTWSNRKGCHKTTPGGVWLEVNPDYSHRKFNGKTCQCSSHAVFIID